MTPHILIRKEGDKIQSYGVMLEDCDELPYTSGGKGSLQCVVETNKILKQEWIEQALTTALKIRDEDISLVQLYLSSSGGTILYDHPYPIEGYEFKVERTCCDGSYSSTAMCEKYCEAYLSFSKEDKSTKLITLIPIKNIDHNEKPKELENIPEIIFLIPGDPSDREHDDITDFNSLDTEFVFWGTERVDDNDIEYKRVISPPIEQESQESLWKEFNNDLHIHYAENDETPYIITDIVESKFIIIRKPQQ